jgi:FtsH-binding integral membrane protein
MSSWVILFFVQSALIVAGNRRVHMKVGVAGAVLAAVIIVLGTCVGILSVHFNPEGYSDLGGARFFLAIMLTGILTFGALIAIGINYRRRPEVHRPMMLLATVVLMTGSLDRWPF